MALFKKNEEAEQKTATPAKKAAPKKAATGEASMKDLYVAGSEKASEKKVVRKTDSAKLARANEILVRPLITEKVTDLNGLNKYVFEVSISANKVEIAKAIEAMYGVKPAKVNMIRYEGKAKTYGRRSGKRKDWKKAIITLPKSKTINVYEGV